CQQESNWPMF
nr:immunoglobulin light chain junction region [Macaca mulatta]MPO01351.1 immunoglobulin light chain junction region [Macaca mulatta]MPO01368.1 immunoglobulin light chain junction region [Macaca mulatta]MPO01827.1 immunoglobulin light chain junction region [Macaca mulatta]